MFSVIQEDYVSAVNKVSQVKYDLDQWVMNPNNNSSISEYNDLRTRLNGLILTKNQFSSAGSDVDPLDEAQFIQDAAILSSDVNMFIQNYKPAPVTSAPASQSAAPNANVAAWNAMLDQQRQINTAATKPPTPSTPFKVNWPLMGIGVASLITAGILWFKKKKSSN